jgi:hypothetical protein
VTTFYDTSSLPFRAAIKVKPLARAWDSLYRTWFVKCRITTRIDYSGRKCGEIIYSRASELYARQGVQRGKCGRLYWADRLTDSELLALPEEVAL